MNVALKDVALPSDTDSLAENSTFMAASFAPSQNWANSHYSHTAEQFSHLEPGSAIGHGTIATAYNVESDQHLVLIDRTASKSGIENSKAKLDAYALIGQGVKAPRVLAVFEKRGRLFEVMEKAPGECVHKIDQSNKDWCDRLQTLASAPQKYYDELLSTLNRLNSVGLSVDTSNPENLFLEQKQGFYYIDLDVGDSCDPDSVVNLLINCRSLARARGSIAHHEKAAIETIITKMSIAGFKLGDTSAYVLTSIGNG